MSDTAEAVGAVDGSTRSDKHRLRSLLAMYGMHALNLALPLVTLPVITRLLGPEEFGRYGVLINISGMALILIEFGLGVSATKAITGKDEPAARSALARVLVYQTVNALIVLPPLGIATYMLMKPRPSIFAVVLALLAAWSLGMTTLWFRVARANVPKLLPATLAAKLSSLVLVVGCLPLWPTLSIALGGNFASSAWPLLDTFSARRELIEAVREFRWADWRKGLRESFAVPLQRVGSGLYLLLPATLVASFFGMTVAGWYVLSDRVIRAGNGVFQPLTSTLFPLQLEVRGLPKDSPARVRLRKYMAGTIGFAAFASLFTFLAAPYAVVIIGGEPFAPAALFLRWMAPLLLLVTINTTLVNALYVQDHEAVIARAVWVCGLGFSALIFLVGKHSQSVFAACCMGVEGMLSAWLFYVWRSHAGSEPATSPVMPVESASE